MVIRGRISDSNRNSGFTLLEVMIAMAILGVGLLSIAVAQLTAIKVASKSKNLQQAMFLAREQMDDLEALPADAPILAAAATTDDPNNPIQVSNDEGDMVRFTRSFTVTPDEPETGLALVVVTVAWNSNQGGVRQVRLSSVKRMN
jgi:prepilin-type N-terminal cleavage/methylation domain-containing protein